MAGSDDILASFVAGNALSWDDWFRQSTAQDSFGSTFESFLNIALFLYLGATCPWESFAPFVNDLPITSWRIPLWRLVCLAMAILGLRRIPVVTLLYKLRLLQPHVQSLRQAVFMGFFGPMGVSSIFYLQELLRFCRKELTVEDGTLRPDAESLYHAARVIIWFIVTSSIVSTTLRPTVIFGDHELTCSRGCMAWPYLYTRPVLCFGLTGHQVARPHARGTILVSEASSPRKGSRSEKQLRSCTQKRSGLVSRLREKARFMGDRIRHYAR
jgi:hypothetical protein